MADPSSLCLGVLFIAISLLLLFFGFYIIYFAFGFFTILGVIIGCILSLIPFACGGYLFYIGIGAFRDGIT